MPYLQLIDLICRATEDDFGHDEIYFVIGGRQIGPREVNESDPWLLIDHTGSRFFSNVTVRMYDEDTHILGDEDDFLGETTVDADEAGLGERRAVFDLDGADYTLTYKVENNPAMVPSYSAQGLLDVGMAEIAKRSGDSQDAVIKTLRADEKNAYKLEGSVNYLDLNRSVTMGQDAFHEAINAGDYPGYMLSKTKKGRVYAKAKANTFPTLNCLLSILRFVGTRMDKHSLEEILNSAFLGNEEARAAKAAYDTRMAAEFHHLEQDVLSTITAAGTGITFGTMRASLLDHYLGRVKDGLTPSVKGIIPKDAAYAKAVKALARDGRVGRQNPKWNAKVDELEILLPGAV